MHGTGTLKTMCITVHTTQGYVYTAYDTVHTAYDTVHTAYNTVHTAYDTVHTAYSNAYALAGAYTHVLLCRYIYTSHSYIAILTVHTYICTYAAVLTVHTYICTYAAVLTVHTYICTYAAVLTVHMFVHTHFWASFGSASLGCTRQVTSPALGADEHNWRRIKSIARLCNH